MALGAIGSGMKGVGDLETLVRVKTELLCRGFRNSETLKRIVELQNPFRDMRTGNAGVQISLSHNLVANVPVGNRYNQLSQYILDEDDGVFVVKKEGSIICKCVPISPPPWYHKLTSDGTPMGSIILREGFHTLIAAIYNRCSYWTDHEECGFCSINVADKPRFKTHRQLAEAVFAAYQIDRMSTLDLTSGNTDTPDRGALKYLEVVRQIKKKSDIPICVEISPPDRNDHIKMLVEAGANAFMINLEIFDDNLRKIFCPGKSEIPKERYFETWKYALGLVGEGKVSSVLIAGLESRESTIRGASELISAGVIPSVMPFRPNDGCYLENFALPSAEDVEFTSREVGYLLYTRKMGYLLHPGCISCTACSTEVDHSQIMALAMDQALLN